MADRTPDGTRERTLDEAFLIERARSGDQSAFRALYDAHVDRVYRLAYRISGDDHMAQEFTQDAFVRAFQKLDQFRGQSRFSTWLHSITVSVAINGSKKVRRLHTRHVALEPDLTGEATAPPDPGLRARIGQAIDALPDIYRTVFLMHDLEGYPHKDIAGTLGIPVGTSKARLSRARASLRGLLGEAAKEYVT